MGAVAGQNVKYVGGRIHPNVFADVAEGRTMGFVRPDGFQSGMGLGAFKLQSPGLQLAANRGWKSVHTRDGGYWGGGLVK
jgi:hypothetical protein